MQPLDDEVLVLDRRNERLHRLNSISADVLERCAGLHTADEIAQQLQQIYEAPPTRIGEDVRALLVRMRALEIVR